MDVLLGLIHYALGLLVVIGSKLGMAGIFALPAAVYLSFMFGERFLRVYLLASTATVGILIATLLTRLVKFSI